jgi:L-ascorbate metabolism protein UlaG (beta-lactamase superfamily)
VKKIISVVGVVLLIVFVMGIVVFESGSIQNFIFYKSGLTPKEVFSLNDKINLSSPADSLAKRTPTLIAIDDYIKSSVKGNGFSMKAYDLVRIRLDTALAEIPKTVVPKGKVKIWYIYNMGIIAKSSDKTVAFDLAGNYVYPRLSDFTKYIDILVITHFHNDHFNPTVVKEALKNGVTVIVPGDTMILKDNEFVRDPNGIPALDLVRRQYGISSDNLISLKPNEVTTVKGVEITAYPANHIGPGGGDAGIAPYPSNWYYVNLSGVRILHAGDGISLENDSALSGKAVDAFITHATTIDPRDNDSLTKLVPNPKIYLPLHVLELGHGSSIVTGSSGWIMDYKNILDNYSNGYYKGGRLMPLIWGESFEL